MKKTFVFSLLIWVLLPEMIAAEATDTSRRVPLVGLKFHQGAVLIHSRHLRPIRNSYPLGVEVDLALHKTSRKAWEGCNCYPKVGIATTFWDYDNPEVLGHGITSMFYLEPVFGARNGWSFSIRAAFGVSYQSKPYDEVSNPDNLSYSTYLAVPLQLGASVHARLKPGLYLDATTAYNHFSNGGIKEPNKGINWPSAALGLTYYLKPPEFLQQEKKDWRTDEQERTRFDVSFLLAYKETPTQVRLFSPGLEVKASRQIGRLNALTLGGEWLYDNATRHEIQVAGRSEDWQKASLAAGHEFLLGKFIFSQQMGFYLYKPYPVGDKFYQRYGLVYRASRRFFFGINLKSHRHVADFPDLRVGFSW